MSSRRSCGRSKVGCSWYSNQLVLSFLNRNLKGCPPSVKERCYTALVRPLVEYVSTVWSPHTTAIINKIEQVQRRAAIDNLLSFYSERHCWSWPFSLLCLYVCSKKGCSESVTQGILLMVQLRVSSHGYNNRMLTVSVCW
jgi:hypothetical protein